ncbi:MAG: helix-turn-helix domain-containing protein, partial [Oscillospiraceae bacterium]|nr:helix-turn-helix domain-containing protein [Oscillospiraceae bacterium]
ISIYCYLLSIEDRETYQCYPSYKTIGKALGMCENTVSKYVRSLEEKGLIRTEPTLIRSKDGRPLNGNLLYTICPIQAAVESFYERQFRQLEEDVARQRAAERLAESARRSPENALCAPLGEREGVDTPSSVESGFGPLSGAFPELASESLPGAEEKAGTKEKAG